MNRVRLALAALAMAAPLALAQDLSKVEIRATQLNDTTYMLTGAGGNIGMSVGEDAVFIIDDQFAPLTDKITAAIRRITPKPVRFVLNTHWHFDHTGGNENFGKAGALIVAHDNVRTRMDSDQFMEFMKLKQPRSPRAALPVVTFAGTMTFHLNGDEIRAIHMPNAHTDGDTIVHFLRSDVIHMGDIYFNGYYPFIDTSSGGSIDGVVAALDKALAVAGDKTRIIPGHGPLATKADMQAYRDMLATVAGRVKDMLAQGRTAEQVIEAGVSKEFDEKWGKGFIPPRRFAEMVVQNLQKRR